MRKILGKISLHLILTTVAVWVGWDVYAYVQGGQQATESFQLTMLVINSIPLVFGLGFLMGHWVWFQTIAMLVDADGNTILIGTLAQIEAKVAEMKAKGK